MFRAYFITTTYSRVKDRKKEIAKGATLEECRRNFQKTFYWEYILYLISERKLSIFEEYVFITKPNGDRIFDTKQFQEEETEKNLPVHISNVIDDILGDLKNES